MRVATEAAIEGRELLVQHRVARDRIVEIAEFLRVRQLAVEQQVADFHEAGIFGEVADRIAAVEEHALVAVDVGDLRLATRGRGKARVIGEGAGLGVEFADIDDIGADRALEHGILDGGVAQGDLCSIGHFLPLMLGRETLRYAPAG